MIKVADLFAGAGGTSTGLIQAAESHGLKLDLLAVNHWEIAVETHSRNHPGAHHLCADIGKVNPKAAVPGGKLDVLIASPECTHFSLARGGKPILDQKRAPAWYVLGWASELLPKFVLVENVAEFQTWGPVGVNGHPLKRRRGEIFAAYIKSFQALGYNVEWRVLNAANYGAATTRQRLFIVAKRGRGPIPWPEQTHAPASGGQREVFGKLLPWRPAKEIIDWSIPGTSIFSRKRPLVPATIERIAAGLRKFCGAAAEPFIVILRNHQNARSIHQPVPTLTTSGANVGLCQPFVVPFSIDNPMPTITSVDAWGYVEPFLTKFNGTGGPESVYDPLDTVTAKDRFGLVQCDGMLLDILFRMLQPHELAAAMGFPLDYQFAGNREQKVRQIGNAVEVNNARALCDVILREVA